MTEATPSGHQRTQAFLEQLFREHVDGVFGYVYARCGSRQIAEDVTSEAFSEAARVCARGHQARIEAGWIYHVAHQRLIDHWRRADRQRRRIERLAHERGSVHTEAFTDPDQTVLSALERLPDRQRAALVLRYLAEFSVTEVADAMDLTSTAVESLLARGRRSFATAYRQLNPEEQ